MIHGTTERYHISNLNRYLIPPRIDRLKWHITQYRIIGKMERDPRPRNPIQMKLRIQWSTPQQTCLFYSFCFLFSSLAAHNPWPIYWQTNELTRKHTTLHRSILFFVHLFSSDSIIPVTVVHFPHYFQHCTNISIFFPPDYIAYSGAHRMKTKKWNKIAYNGILKCLCTDKTLILHKK